MKSTPARFLATSLITSLIAVLLAACGQTGALYMPQQPVKKDTRQDTGTAKPGVAPASAPVPSTPPASQQ